MSLVDGPYEVHQEIKTVMKIYPDFVRLFQYAKPFMLRRFDWSPQRIVLEKKKRVQDDDDKEESERKSLRRAKTKLIDLALSNGFDLFVTFTFDKDRQNLEAKRQQMAFWLNNQRIKYGAFRYVIVMEYHKDGESPHFHALFGGYKGRLKDSGKKDKASRPIFNVQSYQSGFTTAVKIDNIQKTAAYIAKYLTKDMPMLRNKQRYWCSNGLKQPQKIINPLLTDTDLSFFDQEFKTKWVKVLEYKGQLPEKDISRFSDYGKKRTDDLLVTEW